MLSTHPSLSTLRIPQELCRRDFDHVLQCTPVNKERSAETFHTSQHSQHLISLWQGCVRTRYIATLDYIDLRVSSRHTIVFHTNCTLS